jgi:hypothetical protein
LSARKANRRRKLVLWADFVRYDLPSKNVQWN